MLEQERDRQHRGLKGLSVFRLVGDGLVSVGGFDLGNNNVRADKITTKISERRITVPGHKIIPGTIIISRCLLARSPVFDGVHRNRWCGQRYIYSDRYNNIIRVYDRRGWLTELRKDTDRGTFSNPIFTARETDH